VTRRGGLVAPSVSYTTMMDTQDRIAREFRFDVLGQLPGLRRYARSLTRSDIDAEDLVHDALVRAYEKRPSFRAGHNMRVWLMSIMHNVFVDGTRARRAEAQRLAQVGELVEQQLAPGQDHHMRLCQVRQAFIEGLAYADAAAALGIPVGTLMSRIARARAALRAIDDSNLEASTRTRNGHYLRVVGGWDEPSR
jgi:DNA-directed RNA polymerase specialized sigma24 family protein